MLDDRYELDSLTKFAGQVTAAAVMSIVGGIQLLYIYVPFGNIGTIPLDRDASVELTILLTVLTINAINFIDGLDGLAAGITAIQGLAFFGYSYHLASVGNTDIALAPTLICAGLVGACVGFLPHNFASARIFMGDSGSMLVGLMLSAAATTASSQADPQSLGHQGRAAALPAADPADHGARLPAVRPAAGRDPPAVAGQSPFAPDKEHLHHRLMDLGHTHRRAVLLLYFWSAVLAFGAVAMSISRGPWLVVSAVGGRSVRPGHPGRRLPAAASGPALTSGASARPQPRRSASSPLGRGRFGGGGC